MIIRSISLLLFGLWLGSSVMAAGPTRFYKWVDKQGQVHYSDTVPPDAAGQQREVKSQSGQTVQTVEPPPTRQELEARKRAQKAASEAEHRREAQARHDQMLLLTFSSVQEIKDARDDRLRAIASQIELNQERLGKLQTQLEQQQQMAARIERTGKGDPKYVYATITSLQTLIDENRRFIESKRSEQQQIRRDFARDITRYRELMAAGMQSAPDQTGKP